MKNCNKSTNHVVVAIMLVCGFLSVLSNFMMLPVLALYVQEGFNLNAFYVGFVCGIWPLTLTCTTFFSGFMADKFGHMKMLIVGLVLMMVAFALMSICGLLYLFIASQILFGIGKSLLGPSVRVLLVNYCHTDNLKLILRINYLCINIACILGPLAGVVLYDEFKQLSFIFSFVTYLVLFIIVLSLCFLLPHIIDHGSKSDASQEKQFTLKDIRNVLNNNSLFIWVITSTSILFIFGLYESIMPLVLVNEHAGIKFGYLLSINGIVVVLSQLIIIVFRKLNSELLATIIGFVCFVIGFALFSLTNIGNIRFIIGTIAFSLGESYLFPQMELLLNKLSPDNLKATYFGAIEIRQIGFFLGPVCGGMIYHEYGAICLFIFCSIFLFLISILYMKQFFKMLIKS